MKDRIIEDSELGRLVVYNAPRAKQFVFRTKPDAIYVAIPPGGTIEELRAIVEKWRDRLLEHRRKLARPRIDLNYRIDAEFFKLSLIEGEKKQFFANSVRGMMQIVCPPGTDFADGHLQNWLRKVIEEALRLNAKAVLPDRLAAFSAQHGLPYKEVKINSSRGRWGSCSAQKNINLSFFLLLLPSHLIDYVLLHELCHTREMNHSPRFWALLNELTGGKALDLRKELRAYHTAF